MISKASGYKRMDQHDTEMLDESSQPSSSGSIPEGVSNNIDLGIYPRFRVRKWKAIALWAYDIDVENCAICRNHIMDNCIECQAVSEISNTDESCKIARGKCSHVFHMHCIRRWLNTRQVCPLDNGRWEYRSNGT